MLASVTMMRRPARVLTYCTSAMSAPASAMIDRPGSIAIWNCLATGGRLSSNVSANSGGLGKLEQLFQRGDCRIGRGKLRSDVNVQACHVKPRKSVELRQNRPRFFQ